MREDNLNGFKNKTFSINEIFNITLYATPYTSPDATHRLTRRKTSRLNKTILKKIQIKSEIKMIKKYKQWNIQWIFWISKIFFILAELLFNAYSENQIVNQINSLINELRNSSIKHTVKTFDDFRNEQQKYMIFFFFFDI